MLDVAFIGWRGMVEPLCERMIASGDLILSNQRSTLVTLV